MIPTHVGVNRQTVQAGIDKLHDPHETGGEPWEDRGLTLERT